MQYWRRANRAKGKICKILLLGAVSIVLMIPRTDVAFGQNSTGMSLFTLIAFDYPGAVQTSGGGIDGTGQIVGYFIDTSYHIHGFLRHADGTFAPPFDAPNSLSTTAYGIDGTGRIVGVFRDNTNGAVHGFLRSSNGTTFQQIDAPNSHSTSAYGINETGQIAGTFVSNGFSSTGAACEQDPHQAGCTHGFLRSADGTAFLTIDFPGSVETDAFGINGSGQIVGYYYDASYVLHGFLRSADGKSFVTIDATNSVATIAYGINDTGQIVGVFRDASSAIHGFLRDATSGVYSPFDAPNAASAYPGGTYGFGINGSGQISGYFYDANLNLHGFAGKPYPVLTNVPKWYQVGIPDGPCYPGSADCFPNPGNFFGVASYDSEVNNSVNPSTLYTIAQKGCALTALTIVVNYWQGNRATPMYTGTSANVFINPFSGTVIYPGLDPSQVNQWKRLYAGSTGDVNLNTLPLLVNANMLRLLPNYHDVSSDDGFPVFYTDAAQTTIDPYATLDNILNNGAPVILPVFASNVTDPTNAVHFVVVTGRAPNNNNKPDYYVNDPGDQNSTTFRNLTGAHWAQGLNLNFDYSFQSGPVSKPQADVSKLYVFVPLDTSIDRKDPNTLNALSVSSDSPVELILTDPQGRRAGFDPLSNTLFEEIPVSAYNKTLFRDEQTFTPDGPPLKALDIASQMDGLYTLNVIGTGRGSFTVAVRASDTAGNWITQTYSGTTAPGVSSQFTFQGAVITFAAFAANLTISSSHQAFGVSGTFTLGSGGTISPITQPVTIQVGNAFLVTIPAGSFSQSRKGTFVFAGTINGVGLIASLTSTGGSSYSFQIGGQGAPNLPTTNPIDVQLTIGNNGGSTSVNANFVQ